MIEAVNSAVANASLVRGSAEQLSSAGAANVARARQEAQPRELPVAPFVSPYIVVDVNFDKAVLQIRDGDTGDVVDQFPSRSSLEARQRAEVASTPVQAQSTASTQPVQASLQSQQVVSVEAQAAAQAFSAAAQTTLQGSGDVSGDVSVFA